MTVGNNENWMEISDASLKDGVKRRLCSSSQASIDACASGIKILSQSLQHDFMLYWNDKPFDRNLSVATHSLNELVEHRDMTVIGAFLALDWLLKDPVAAKESLKRGYDTLSFGPRSDEERGRIEARKVELARDNLI